ncbi:MAG TPA: NAD(+) synthase [Pirellulaceae bacterium]|nr:NAD(+) synthase [Pirellulaceae bacterium]HMO91070.1 NAD(+) synthase [Pirellulaceae bacterium]HMP68184.1 NAD(+) synthase [Pirellulaceae bacterium]
MSLIRVAAGVLNQTPLDWKRNFDNICAAIEIARAEKVHILCLPELCITGYGCEDAFFSVGVHSMALDVLDQIVERTEGMVVSVGLPLMYAGGLFNAACLICDREIAGFVGKQHLAGDGIHYEPRWFKRWPAEIQASFTHRKRHYPLGDLLFDCGGVKIGFEICEDAWVGTRPGSSLASRGVDIILNPSASHFAFDKHAVRSRFVLEGSRAFHVTYVYSNLVGNEAGRAIYDGGAMIASGGKLLAVGRRFGFPLASITTATVDLDDNRMMRSRTGSFEPDVDGDESDVIQVPFDFTNAAFQMNEPRKEAWENGPNIKFEEFTRAVSLGLFDYMLKSRSKGVVVSLSGGVDSASVAVLARLMLEFAVQQLGEQSLIERLAYVELPQQPMSVDLLSRHLIKTAYQATTNSSLATRNAAAELAEAIRCQHLELDVSEMVDAYIAMIEGGIGRKLSWETDDITLQNIQARVRSPSIWMLANLSNSLLLSTSNRSEAAVGYATMDGDTSGGLAPIAGIDKAFLRRWLHWMETAGPEGLHPIPELNHVNQLPPKAELRPASFGQTDEDDLMPYDRLDEIERQAIRDKRTPLAIFRNLVSAWPEVKPLQIGQWIDKFFRLWCRNQWKRERYAPSFHLDDANLDPKTWCRYPILSGGSEVELRQMWDYVNKMHAADV